MGTTANNRRYAVACTLVKSFPGGVSVAGTLHILTARSEDEARGAAVRMALAQKPDFLIDGILSACVDGQEDGDGRPC